MPAPLCKLARIEILPEQRQVKFDLKLEGEVDLLHAYANYIITDEGISICNFNSDREWLTELFKVIPITANGKTIRLKEKIKNLVENFL